LAKLIIVGVNHLTQLQDDSSMGFNRLLRYLYNEYTVEVVMEEWRETPEATVGKRLATELGIDWENVGTPSGGEFKTFARYPAWHGDSCIEIHPYGPLESQSRRESTMIEKTKKAMSGKNTGLFICGLAHLHSLFAKLHKESFEVEAFVKPL
jgi:hypothetical protein